MEHIICRATKGKYVCIMFLGFGNLPSEITSEEIGNLRDEEVLKKPRSISENRQFLYQGSFDTFIMIRLLFNRRGVKGD